MKKLLIGIVAAMLALGLTGGLLWANTSSHAGMAPVSQHGGDNDAKMVMPFLGIKALPLTPGIAKRLGIEQQEGILVVSVVPDGPADKAGVEAKDIIVAVDGDKISRLVDLLKSIKDKQPGDVVSLTVVRAGTELVIPVTVGERPAREPSLQMGMPLLKQLLDLANHGAFKQVAYGKFILVQGDEKPPVTVEVNVGKVAEVKDNALAIDRKDGQKVNFDITADALILKRGQKLVLGDLEVGANVVVVQTDGTVRVVLVEPLVLPKHQRPHPGPLPHERPNGKGKGHFFSPDDGPGVRHGLNQRSDRMFEEDDATEKAPQAPSETA